MVPLVLAIGACGSGDLCKLESGDAEGRYEFTMNGKLMYVIAIDAKGNVTVTQPSQPNTDQCVNGVCPPSVTPYTPEKVSKCEVPKDDLCDLKVCCKDKTKESCFSLHKTK